MKVALIPALNEEDTIGSVVLGTQKHVDKIIVIDDGSTDKTAEIVRLAGAEVAQHAKNEGKGIALKTGFKVAKKYNADVVVCIDADGQHNPDDIPEMIAPILSGEAEMVIGSRYINKEHKKDIPKYRRLGLWILTKTINFGSEVKTTDSQCGFRAFSGDILDRFIFSEKGLSVESEMLEDAIDNDISIAEVPISAKYEGLDTSTEKPGKHGFGVLNFTIRAVRERHPLLFFGVSGAILLILGLILGVFCLDCFFSNGFIPFGPALAASVLILLGTLGVFAGLILNSISGMIQGLARLSRHRQEPVTMDTQDDMIHPYKLLRPNNEEILPRDINGNGVPGVTAPSYYPKIIVVNDVNGHSIPGLPALNYISQANLIGNIRNNGITGLPLKMNNHEESNIAEINNQIIHGIPQLNNHNDESLLEELNNVNNVPEITTINDNRDELLLKDIEDDKIQM
jgi:glycosyltransferase involved in cell wall biosynthesis